jgi:hypothetical protein
MRRSLIFAFCIFLVNTLALHSAEVYAQNVEATAAANVSGLPAVSLLPDNPLYFLKTLKENIQLTITRSSSGQANLLLDFAQKRLAEALKVTEKGKVHISEKLFAAFGRDIEAAKEKIGEAKRQGEQTRGLLIKLQQTVDYQRAVLEKMQEEAQQRSEEVQARIEVLNDLLVQVEETLEEASDSGKIDTRLPKKASGLGVWDWLQSLFISQKKILRPLAN